MRRFESKVLAENSTEPARKYLIVYIFAGHSIRTDSALRLCYNEYDDESSFYKMLSVEEKLQTIAAKHSNAYVVGLFACASVDRIAD